MDDSTLALLDSILKKLNTKITLFPSTEIINIQSFSQLEELIKKEIAFWKPIDNDIQSKFTEILSRVSVSVKYDPSFFPRV